MTIQTNMISRIKYALLAFSLIILATTLNIAQNKPLPTLRGTEAVENLKENGQYDSLIEALKATRDKTGQTAETPTEDAVGQSAKLVASDGASNDEFGFSVAISGDTAIVGAYQDAVGANNGQGSAYIFVRSGTVWTQQQKLTAADGAINDNFGISVAISGDTAIVGAFVDSVGANSFQGSAYVFARSGAVWTQQQKLTAADGAANDRFGYSVAISGDTAIVGAYQDAVGANNGQGSAYIFVRSGTVWTQQQKLTAADGAFSDNFGISVAISGETALISAYNDDTGVNANQGSAYIFTRSGTVWTEQQKLTALDGAANDQFGNSVAISGDTAIVGVVRDAIGASPDQGSAYIFTRSGTVWTEQQKLTALDGAANDRFGNSVAISGNTAIVGAITDRIEANSAQGSAYVFTRSETVWTQGQQLTSTDGAAGDFFGQSVAISGNNVIVGADLDDVGANANQGSAYVFRNLSNVWTQEAQKVASDGAASDNFGYSVAISGDTAIVGAYRDDGAFTDQGSVYIFTRSGTVWSQQQKLENPDPAANDLFGYGVAISGDTVIVGAYQDDGTFTNQGAAYVFTRSGTVWSQQQKLNNPDPALDDRFGISVAISGNTVIVGAYIDDGAFTNQGSVYIFTRSGAVWSQQQKLLASDAAAGDFFGYGVAISGDTVIVGAYSDDGAFLDQGAAYVFARSGTVWSQQAKLDNPDPEAGAFFAYSVAISGDTIVVGSYNDDDAFTNQGAAYVFTRSGAVWSQQQKLLASDAAGGDNFGFSVAISGDTVVVGAFADSGAFTNQGAAYVFERSGIIWTQKAKLTDSAGAAGDFFGWSVAISGDKIVVGAPNSDASTSTPLTNRDGLVPTASDQGAALFFVNSPLAPTAANVSIGGRIFTPEGEGLRNAIVHLTKPDGTTVSTRSTSFGYYRFENLGAGQIYVIGVNSKLYTFAPRVVQASYSLTDIDFTAFE